MHVTVKSWPSVAQYGNSFSVLNVDAVDETQVDQSDHCDAPSTSVVAPAKCRKLKGSCVQCGCYLPSTKVSNKCTKCANSSFVHQKQQLRDVDGESVDNVEHSEANFSKQADFGQVELVPLK